MSNAGQDDAQDDAQDYKMSIAGQEHRMSISQDPQLMSAMSALAAIYSKPHPKTKLPAKKRRLSKAVNKFSKKKEGEMFEYNWPRCACGMDHPPVPDFDPPNRKRCTYYWQIADVFPYVTLYRALTTEIKFKEADTDQSGVIEFAELSGLLKNVFGSKISERMLKRTFKEIDTDGSGTLDFLEVLTVVNKVVQREETHLPTIMKESYSKVCSIQ